MIADFEVTLGEKRFFYIVHGEEARYYEFDPVFRNSIDKSQSYGVAVDIGTTYIAASLNDLKNTGHEVSAAAVVDPQTKYGEDAVARINFAHENKGNLGKLKKAVVKAINKLLTDLCKRNNANAREYII